MSTMYLIDSASLRNNGTDRVGLYTQVKSRTSQQLRLCHKSDAPPCCLGRRFSLPRPAPVDWSGPRAWGRGRGQQDSERSDYDAYVGRSACEFGSMFLGPM